MVKTKQIPCSTIQC